MSLRSMFTKKHAINLTVCALSFLISPALAVDFNTPVVNDENDFVIENNVYQNVNVEPGIRIITEYLRLQTTALFQKSKIVRFY